MQVTRNRSASSKGENIRLCVDTKIADILSRWAIRVHVTIRSYPPGFTSAGITIYFVCASAVYTRVRVAIVDIAIAIHAFPTGFTGTGITIYAVRAGTMYARVGLTFVNIDIANRTLPSGITRTGIAVYSVSAGTMCTWIRIAVVYVFAGVAITFPTLIACAY
jgi:hypothetical protein